MIKKRHHALVTGKRMLAKKLLDGLICPITLEILRDPVICEDEHVYERRAILMHLSKENKSPITRTTISSNFRDAISIRNTVETLLEYFPNEKEKWLKVPLDAREAQNFMKCVREEFSEKPHVFKVVCDILNMFYSERLQCIDAIILIKTILRYKEALLKRFFSIIGEDRILSCELGTAICINAYFFLQDVKQRCGASNYDKLLQIIHYLVRVDINTVHLPSVYVKVKELLLPHYELIDMFFKFVPSY